MCGVSAKTNMHAEQIKYTYIDRAVLHMFDSFSVYQSHVRRQLFIYSKTFYTRQRQNRLSAELKDDAEKRFKAEQ